MQNDDLLRDVLPAVFRNPASIGDYGRVATSPQAARTAAAPPEQTGVQALAADLAQIVRLLGEAHPSKISRKPNVIDRLLGRALEAQVRHRVALSALDDMLAQADQRAAQVRREIAAFDAEIERHGEDERALILHIQAGRKYLAEHPDAGRPRLGEQTFENTRERFERRLTNLELLLTSTQQAAAQMKLSRAPAQDMLDRYDETSQVLMQVWRRQVHAVAHAGNVTSAMLADATQAHDALSKALSPLAPGNQAQDS